MGLSQLLLGVFNLHAWVDILGDDFFLEIEEEIFKWSLNFINIYVCSPKIISIVAYIWNWVFFVDDLIRGLCKTVIRICEKSLWLLGC